MRLRWLVAGSSRVPCGDAHSRQSSRVWPKSSGCAPSCSDMAALGADIRQPLAALLGKEATDIANIRKTDSPPRISVVDVVAAITGMTGANAGHYYERLRDSHPEVCTICTNYRFPGRGQRNTPVTDARGIVEIIMLLPGRHAARVRRQAAELLVRYLTLRRSR